ncbi:TPA: hypothetical protein H2R31_003062 [Salmonella enterica]|nr:hypothetical protein [Salmonella enterica]EJC5509671.1 hypothetical protein [Salmonella enterica]HAK6118011.1 hypothetical protein [Salmonella enterica]
MYNKYMIKPKSHNDQDVRLNAIEVVLRKTIAVLSEEQTHDIKQKCSQFYATQLNFYPDNETFLVKCLEHAAFIIDDF